MTATGQEKIVQYLNEAGATERALIRTLQSHIAMAPAGDYRRDLEQHLRETRSHAERVDRRLEQLGVQRSLLEQGIGLVQGLAGQALALGKGPFDLVRGGSVEEKLLKNAKDECASEALELATYRALERAARALDDESTAALASSIAEQEAAMLERLQEHLPALVDDAVHAEVEGTAVHDRSTIGALQEVKRGGRAAARRIPGVRTVEGELEGAKAEPEDLPIDGYDELNVEQVNERLDALSQHELAIVDGYERRHAGRRTVLDRIASLRASEPWAGYDDQNVAEIVRKLDGADDERIRAVQAYERRHKQRRGVLDAAERD